MLRSLPTVTAHSQVAAQASHAQLAQHAANHALCHVLHLHRHMINDKCVHWRHFKSQGQLAGTQPIGTRCKHIAAWHELASLAHTCWTSCVLTLALAESPKSDAHTLPRLLALTWLTPACCASMCISMPGGSSRGEVASGATFVPLAAASRPPDSMSCIAWTSAGSGGGGPPCFGPLIWTCS